MESSFVMKLTQSVPPILTISTQISDSALLIIRGRKLNRKTGLRSRKVLLLRTMSYDSMPIPNRKDPRRNVRTWCAGRGVGTIWCIDSTAIAPGLAVVGGSDGFDTEKSLRLALEDRHQIHPASRCYPCHTCTELEVSAASLGHKKS